MVIIGFGNKDPFLQGFTVPKFIKLALLSYQMNPFSHKVADSNSQVVFFLIIKTLTELSL